MRDQRLYFKNHLCTFTAVDFNSSNILTKLCTNRVGVIDHLESLCLYICYRHQSKALSNSHDQCVHYLIFHSVGTNELHLIPCVLSEHDTVRLVEQTHRTLQEITVKCLAFKPHFSSEYWGLAYEYNTFPQNIISDNLVLL